MLLDSEQLACLVPVATRLMLASRPLGVVRGTYMRAGEGNYFWESL